MVAPGVQALDTPPVAAGPPSAPPPPAPLPPAPGVGHAISVQAHAPFSHVQELQPSAALA